MSDVMLTPRAAFDGLVLPGRYGAANGDAPGVTLQPVARRAIVTLAAAHGATPALAELLQATWSIALPDGPRRATGREISVIGIGPGRWLAVAETDAGQPLLLGAAALVSGLAAVTDQTHSLAGLRISGPRARDALAKGCPIDLHPRVFGPECAATTIIAHIPAHVWHSDAGTAFELHVPLSYASALWCWITASAAEYGYTVSSL